MTKLTKCDRCGKVYSPKSDFKLIEMDQTQGVEYNITIDSYAGYISFVENGTYVDTKHDVDFCKDCIIAIISGAKK